MEIVYLGKSSSSKEEPAPSCVPITGIPFIGDSKHKESDQNKKRMKRKIQISTRFQEKEEEAMLRGLQVKKIKLEPEEQESIELTIEEDLTQDEPHHSTRNHGKRSKHPTITVGRRQQQQLSDVTTVTVKKQKRSVGAASNESREFYGSIAVKQDPHRDSSGTGIVYCCQLLFKDVFRC